MSSSVFFYGSLALFGLQSAWIAISTKFPMVFDEGYHFGVIKLYAQQWSPFFAHQPVSMDRYGALTRDPSYLFHYLMSFPYRGFHALVPSFMANIIFLRFIDIAMVAVGVILFRKVLLAVGLSRALVNVLLLCIVLLPVMPFLAAHINYDNMLFPLVAGALLLSVKLIQQVRRTRRLSLAKVAGVLSLCCLASITKYSFLPLFFGIAVGLAGVVLVYRHGLRLQWGQVSRLGAIALVALTLLSVGLFVERYGYNTLRYHTPIPQCDKVLSMARCQADGMWARNYALAQKPHPAMSPGRFEYFNVIWTKIMASGLFSVVDANHGGRLVAPVRLLVSVAAIVIGSGLILAVLYWRAFKPYVLPMGFLLLVAFSYGGALWLQNMADFTHLGTVVAVQARYLLPVLPLLIVIPGVGIAAALRDRPRWNMAFATATIAVFLLTGGVATYIIGSNQSWYWNDGRIATINDASHRVLEKILR